MQDRASHGWTFLLRYLLFVVLCTRSNATPLLDLNARSLLTSNLPTADNLNVTAGPLSLRLQFHGKRFDEVNILQTIIDSLTIVAFEDYEQPWSEEPFPTTYGYEFKVIPSVPKERFSNKYAIYALVVTARQMFTTKSYRECTGRLFEGNNLLAALTVSFEGIHVTLEKRLAGATPPVLDEGLPGFYSLNVTPTNSTPGLRFGPPPKHFHIDGTNPPMDLYFDAGIPSKRLPEGAMRALIEHTVLSICDNRHTRPFYHSHRWDWPPELPVVELVIYPSPRFTWANACDSIAGLGMYLDKWNLWAPNSWAVVLNGVSRAAGHLGIPSEAASLLDARDILDSSNAANLTNPTTFKALIHFTGDTIHSTRMLFAIIDALSYAARSSRNMSVDEFGHSVAACGVILSFRKSATAEYGKFKMEHMYLALRETGRVMKRRDVYEEWNEILYVGNGAVGMGVAALL